MNFDKRYDRHEFLRFLESFLPEDFTEKIEEVHFEHKTTYIRQVTRLGRCQSLDLLVYEMRHNSVNDARVGLSKEAFRFLANEWEGRALVLFVPENNDANYRFSLITIDLDMTEEGKTLKRYSNPRRYSYYLGEGIAWYTPNKYLNEAGRVKDEKDLIGRFSVEVLTKAFYQELSDWYAWAVNVVRFPNKLNDPTDDDKFNAESTIRLVTRLIFVWFLKQKHLIPEEFFDETYIRENLLENFNPNTKVDLFYKSNESKYYKAILQNLFFAMLNSPITPEGGTELSERHFRNGRSDYDNNKLMRYESMFKNPQLFVELANRTVPFLNGGLFDCLDEKDNGVYIDGFSDRETVKKALIVPDYLFFGEEVGKNLDLSGWYGDNKKKRVCASGIIDILKRYNFTVEENTPFDQEVSLDPELLGKVFENLLASYNPETQTTARKQTGSFYTPREIVQYMVDESLVAHLKRTVGDELEEQYRQLMRYTDEEVLLTDAQRKQIMQSLYHCKVLDPACGSGAFPMGMLQQMVHILNRIDPDNEMWKEMMFNVAIDETSEAYRTASSDERREMIADIERSFDESVNRPDYARKLYLIENCIYGVDIQPIAIQISKLRFFISLVVDQKANDNPAENFGIRPLPNLEAKFVAANTLIGLDKKDSSLFDTPEILAKKEELKIAKHKIFGAKTVRTKRKYKDAVNRIRQEIAELLRSMGAIGESEATVLASWDMFDQNASSPFFDPEWMFDVKEGFDIVIGNPPYGANIDNMVDILKALYPRTSHGYKEIYKYFYDRGLSLLCAGGILAYITPNTFLRQPRYKDLRKLMLEMTILQILDLGEHIFEAVVPTAIILLMNKGTTSHTLLYGDLTTAHKGIDLFQNISLVEKCQQDFGIIPNSIFVSTNLNSDNNQFCLSDIFEMKDCGFKYQRINVGLAQKGKNDLAERIFYFGEALHDKDIPILTGKDISQYYYTLKPNKKLRYNYESLLKANEHTYYNKKIMDEPMKLIWRQTAPYFIGTILSNHIFFGNTIQAGIIKTKYKDMISYPCLCGLLNSKYLRYRYELNVKETGRVFPQVKLEKLRTLPIVIPVKEIQDTITNIVNEIITLKKDNPQTDTAKKEQIIDSLVYHLYGLTYDEVLIVDPQTPITREEYEKHE
ncbi:TaqI-like C-terminal specificity domain-containing protein [uncultured Alistipes sp.]|uniref:Eco57I restriction-modification methylase domain-containing protein n=1 Tax=uncultured Alistipes sp. TaxID=538949 RepID=UPI0025ECF409|nr:TaqI-like C-terminal specificity domain-containing protein [uncultured Alistipes sp.]